MFWNHTHAARMLEDSDVYVFGDKVATCLVRGENGDIHLQYHQTRVVTFHDDNTFTLNSGGYLTSTTKRRINEYGPCHVYQRKGEWFIRTGKEEDLEFYDGIRVDSFGDPVEESIFPNIRDKYATEITVDNQIRKTHL